MEFSSDLLSPAEFEAFAERQVAFTSAAFLGAAGFIHLAQTETEETRELEQSSPRRSVQR